MALPISEIKALKLCPAKSSLLLLGNFSAVIPNQKTINEGKLLMAYINEQDFQPPVKRQAIHVLSLETFKTRLDRALSNLI